MATQLAGFDGRVSIDDSDYSVKQFSITATATALDVSNTEGIPGGATSTGGVGYASKIPGLMSATFRFVSATYNEDDNIFGTPITVRIGEYHQFDVLPNKTGSKTFRITSGLVTSVSLDGDVEGVQPVTLEGVSDGYFDFASPAAE